MATDIDLAQTLSHKLDVRRGLASHRNGLLVVIAGEQSFGEWTRSNRRRHRSSLDIVCGVLSALRSLPSFTYVRAIPYALAAAVFIGVPSDLIDTPIFGRPVETRPIDYVIWAITSALIGLVFAIRLPATHADEQERNDMRTVWGGFVSFLAVGCPVCNQLVVVLLGTSGALSWWAPAQPFVGAAAIGLVLWALSKRLNTYEMTSCPVPGLT